MLLAMTQTVFITGAAGFIGFHLAKRLCESKPHMHVIGLDNLNDYYDPQLKTDRLALLEKHDNFTFVKGDLADRALVSSIFEKYNPAHVIHLGAQAGVRYSLENPYSYIDSNITGTLNILEGCRHYPVEHLIFASSSSVYGANTKIPFSETDLVAHPVSLYAATKKSNEMMAHSYAHLYGIPCTGLRFFTVYGPWGRPDMAYFKFMNAMVKGKAIDVYNHGKMKRDFTYVDDIIEGIIRLMPNAPTPDKDWDSSNPNPASSSAPYRLYNIGNNQPENLMDMITILQEESGLKAELNMMPMQAGDVVSTYADIDSLSADTGFRPDTSLREGLRRFVGWYREYYDLGNGPTK